MVGSTYFYNSSIKKIVSIFGTVFNDISIAKKINGVAAGITRVPLSYGPRQRFLSRLQTHDIDNPGHIAIKLPRMSFEITSIAYDNAAKLNRLNTDLLAMDPATGHRKKIYQSTPYRIGMTLSVMAHHQDDALQVVEQILPYFNPEYTIKVKDLEGPDTLTDIPITLGSVNFQDDYEGDFENSRRLIVYSLEFDIRVKFVGPVIETGKYIAFTEVNMYDKIDPNADPVDRVSVQLGDPENDTPTNFTTITTFGFE